MDLNKNSPESFTGSCFLLLAAFTIFLDHHELLIDHNLRDGEPGVITIWRGWLTIKPAVEMCEAFLCLASKEENPHLVKDVGNRKAYRLPLS